LQYKEQPRRSDLAKRASRGKWLDKTMRVTTAFGDASIPPLQPLQLTLRHQQETVAVQVTMPY
jgi:hypothetical protein